MLAEAVEPMKATMVLLVSVSLDTIETTTEFVSSAISDLPATKTKDMMLA